MHSLSKYIILICFAGVIFSLEYFFDQKDFFQAFPLYSLAFLLLFLIYKTQVSFAAAMSTGLLVRLCLVFIFPGFSDDVYRFYWDGRLIIEGYNPYGILPVEAIKLDLPYLDSKLLDAMNSPEYFTIYPPINQLYFAISALGCTIGKSVMIMKTLIVFTEILGLMFLMKIMRRNQIAMKNGLLFYLNPLIILEGVGNLHFELAMLAFLIIAVYYLFETNYIGASFFMALSIGIKLLPLMLLPFLYFRMKKCDRNIFFKWLAFFIILIFLPLFWGLGSSSFFESIDLYFRKFEFNASIYYLLRFAGNLLFGYNLIQFLGPLLGLLTLIINIYLALKSRIYSEVEFFQYALMVWTVYLLLATTVHPWYICSPVLFGVISGRSYPFFWSFLTFLSYVNYSYTPYYENLWYISLEYLLLFAVMWYENKKTPFLIT